MRATEGGHEQFKKEGKTRINILNFIYTIQSAYLKVYTKIVTLAPIEAEKSVTEIPLESKKNE